MDRFDNWVYWGPAGQQQGHVIAERNGNEFVIPTSYWCHVRGRDVLCFEVVSGSSAPSGRTDDHMQFLAVTPTGDTEIARRCVQCQSPWDWPGTGNHVRNAQSQQSGEANYWVSLRIYRDGAPPYPHDEKRWLGFTRPARIPGGEATCCTQAQVNASLAQGHIHFLRGLMGNCARFAEHWFPDAFIFDDVQGPPAGWPHFLFIEEDERDRSYNFHRPYFGFIEPHGRFYLPMQRGGRYTPSQTKYWKQRDPAGGGGGGGNPYTWYVE